MKSNLEEQLYWQIKVAKLPLPVREFKFHPIRKWRFDFAWLKAMLSVEIQGGIYIHGAHNRGGQYESDCEKTCEAVLLGWRMLPVTGKMVKDGRALKYLEGMLK